MLCFEVVVVAMTHAPAAARAMTDTKQANKQTVIASLPLQSHTGASVPLNPILIPRTRIHAE